MVVKSILIQTFLLIQYIVEKVVNFLGMHLWFSPSIRHSKNVQNISNFNLKCSHWFNIPDEFDVVTM